MTKRALYAAYVGGWCVCIGTAEQVAEYTGVKPSTVQNGATPSIRKRMDGMHNRRARYYHVPDDGEDPDE